MMARLVILLIFLCWNWGAVVGQQQLPDECLMKCTNEHYKNAPGANPMTMMNAQPVKVGNTTAMCPKINNTNDLDSMCAPVKQLKQCVDPCPDTPIKKLTMAAFRAQQFFCVDRFDDVKKNMPCLSDSCPDVQAECNPKCGAIEASSQKVANLFHDVQGGAGRPPGVGPPGRGNVTVPPFAGQDVDMSAIMNIIGETCSAINCFMTCSEAPVTRKCGKDAYLLLRDLTWTMFSSIGQSMGLQRQWPDQCKALANGQAPNGTTPGGPVVTGTPVAKDTVGTAAATPVPKGNDTVKCDKPPCGAAATLIPSFLLLIGTIFMAARNF